MEQSEKIRKMALQNSEELQQQCHKSNEILMKNNPNLSVQDCTNVFLYQKIGELQAVNTLLLDILIKKNNV